MTSTNKLRSEKELHTSLLFYAVLICMYALLFGIAYGELRERSRLLNIKETYGDGVQYFTSDAEGLEKARKYVESLNDSTQPQKPVKKVVDTKKET